MEIGREISKLKIRLNKAFKILMISTSGGNTSNFSHIF
jgi:hypothetical protein